MPATTYSPTGFFQAGFLQLSKRAERWGEHRNDRSSYHHKNEMVPQNLFPGRATQTCSAPDHDHLCCFEKRSWDSLTSWNRANVEVFYWYISDYTSNYSSVAILTIAFQDRYLALTVFCGMCQLGMSTSE